MVVADVQLGVEPTIPQPRRKQTSWAFAWQPDEWERLNTNEQVTKELKLLADMLDEGSEHPDSTPITEVLTRFRDVSSPEYFEDESRSTSQPKSDDPIHVGIGRLLGRLKRGANLVRSSLPARASGSTKCRVNREELYKIMYDSTDRWAEPAEQAADMRASLRYRHCVTAQHWWTWLERLYAIKQQLQRSAKHHKLLWAKSRREYEIARANLEARAG